jgi:hypothetical protein
MLMTHSMLSGIDAARQIAADTEKEMAPPLPV